MKKAILDLGTNTFNLLIAEVYNENLQILHDYKLPVKLAKGGIHKNLITQDALERAYAAIAKHKQSIDKYKVDEIIAIGTSALRSAANAPEFVDYVQKNFQMKVIIIDGDTEAGLIYKGVKASLEEVPENPWLIVDIGGGSNEIIVANNQDILWKQSFDLGIGRMLEHFPPSNPLKTEELNKYLAYNQKELKPFFDFWDALHAHSGLMLGASGAFETFLNMFFAENKDVLPPDFTSKNLPVQAFAKIYNNLLYSSDEQRLKMPGMEPMRVEMIVYAVVFTNLIISHCGITQLWVSNYSLKEGAAIKWMK